MINHQEIGEYMEVLRLVECVSDGIMSPSTAFAKYRSIRHSKPKLPHHYIINKRATILFWNENDTNDKTVVRRTKGDKHNARLAFLTAYFQGHSGLSKCKANQYLAGLKEVE